MTLLYVIPLALLSVPAFGILAMESFQKALNPRNAWRVLKVNFGGFATAWGLGMATSIELGMFGVLFCIIGTYPAFVLTYGLMGQYYGIAYRDAMEKWNRSN